MLRACLLIGLAVVLAPSSARADAPPPPVIDPVATQSAMEDYFRGEIHGGYLLIGLGVAGLASGGLLYRSGTPIRKGLAYPLLGVGVLHLAAGIYVGIASSRRIDTFRDQIARDPSAFLATERPRMKGVSRTFTILKIAEVTLIAGGLTMAAIGRRTDRPRLQGAGFAIALELAATLGFDIWASARAHDYRDRMAAIQGEF
jgi:hypothetical protein